MDFNASKSSPDNSLFRLTSVVGAFLGLSLLAAAYGHFAAVWPAIDAGSGESAKSRFLLLLPGLVLTINGLINIVVCRALWLCMNWALNTALVFNAMTTIYLLHLLVHGVPDHPIGFFVALVLSVLVLLIAIRMGLVWPAVDISTGKLSETIDANH